MAKKRQTKAGYSLVPIKTGDRQRLIEAALILKCQPQRLLDDAVADYLECTAAPYVQGVLERSGNV